MSATPPFTTAPFITSPALEKAGARHGFFGRAGGVSTDFYASLNTGPGSNDDPASIAENRARCARALGTAPARLLTLYQIHSAKTVVAEAPWPEGERPGGAPPQADGLVTRTPGLAIGALAADCMPVLMIDAHAGVIGAAHAGWRGALAGVLEATVAAMTRLGAAPARVVAAFGPCLRRENFEVGLDLVETFTAKYPSAEEFFHPDPNPQKRRLDLVGFGTWRLRSAGVVTIDDVNRCTLGRPDEYFSYRASRRAGAPDYGRNLSAIALPDG